MKCPKCGNEMLEMSMFLHYEKCEMCGYEEEDIFKGESKCQKV